MTHTSTEQPEALRLASWLEHRSMSGVKPNELAAAAELRRLREELTKLHEELAEETEAAENWRRLALQFDNHRMQAIGHLKAVTNPAACFDKYKAAKAFLSAPPLGGEEVLAQRIAALAANAKQVAPVQEGWCDGCSPDNCAGCGPNQERGKK